jgi:hypothetical protein
MHLHTVYMAYSECLPTHLSPLAERACFSQVRGLDFTTLSLCGAMVVFVAFVLLNAHVSCWSCVAILCRDPFRAAICPPFRPPFSTDRSSGNNQGVAEQEVHERATVARREGGEMRAALLQ